jgi:hypothetical protein
VYFNDSINLLDGLSYVERYSYFGAFRSNKSDVGSKGTFLNANGDLTGFGSLYLGDQVEKEINQTSPQTPSQTSSHASPKPTNNSSTRNSGGINTAVTGLAAMVVGWIATELAF